MAFPATVVGASRPHPSETENGDGWSAAWSGQRCRLAVVDGLGHGPDAAAIARLALDVVAGANGASSLETLRACHAALAGTRGAAATIATLDLAAGRVSYAGVGNVEARLWCGDRWRVFMPARGIVGYRWPSSISQWEEALAPDWLLLMYSDGIESRALPPGRPEAAGQQLVDGLLARGARVHDDATVVGAWQACP